jgi:CRP-like cAMP-binding protein
MEQKTVDALSRLRLLYNIDSADFSALLLCMGAYQRKYQKSEYIIFDGEALEHIGAVLSGRVQMLKEDFWGGKNLLSITQPGDIFGESIVCGGLSSSIVSFRVVEDCEILFLPFKKVLHTCGRPCPFHQQLVDNMVSLIAEKNVQLLETLEVLSKKRIRERILTFLSQHMQKKERCIVQSELGRTDLADYLCVDRSALTRELNNMKDAGIIEFEKNTFILKQNDAVPPTLPILFSEKHEK